MKTMTDQEIAAILRDYCSRRMSGPDTAFCEMVASGAPLGREAARHLEHLKTQFAFEIVHYQAKP
jgi:hypothetical protein